MTPHTLLFVARAPADDRIHTLLGAALRATAPVGEPASGAPGPYWTAAHHGLHRVSAFLAAPPSAQQRVLARLSHDLLAEAWHIEAAGIAYAARRIELAATLEERAVYALIAADEARHLHAVAAWLPDGAGPPSAFHALLAEIVTTAPPAAAVLIVQVLLEGWGMRHYTALADACVDSALAAMLRAIVADECRHHGTGLLLTHQRGLPAEELDATLSLLRRFLAMVRVGPLGVLAALEMEVGPMSVSERIAVLRELRGEDHAADRLRLLRGLLSSTPLQPVRDALDAAGLFSPVPPEAAALEIP